MVDFESPVHVNVTNFFISRSSHVWQTILQVSNVGNSHSVKVNVT